MRGPYAQTRVAIEALDSYLKSIHVTPAGPPFGCYDSERHWEVGYPVSAGTSVAAPFQLISLPATLNASAVVSAPWGEASSSRWAAFLKSVLDQGYAPTGPAMEIWSGEDSQPGNQSTEMRMPVTQAQAR
jgi:hypothetical protein